MRWPKEDEIRWVEWESRRVRFDPDGEHSPIAESPEDLEIWLEHERDTKSWKEIGDSRFPNLKPEARRSEARRAHDRVERYLKKPQADEFKDIRLKRRIKDVFGVSAEEFRAFIVNGHIPKPHPRKSRA